MSGRIGNEISEALQTGFSVGVSVNLEAPLFLTNGTWQTKMAGTLTQPLCLLNRRLGLL